MKSNHMIKIAVTKDQKERIIARAKQNGYATVSAFIRDLALNSDFYVKFNRLYNHLIKNESSRMDSES